MLVSIGHFESLEVDLCEDLFWIIRLCVGMLPVLVRDGQAEVLIQIAEGEGGVAQRLVTVGVGTACAASVGGKADLRCFGAFDVDHSVLKIQIVDQGSL